MRATERGDGDRERERGRERECERDRERERKEEYGSVKLYEEEQINLFVQ